MMDDWDIIEEELAKEPEEHHRHSAMAMGAAAQARDAAEDATEAAEKAVKAGERIEKIAKHIEDLVERVDVLAGLADGLRGVAEAVRETHKDHAKHLAHLTRALTSGRRVIRDDSGRVTGMEPI